LGLALDESTGNESMIRVGDIELLISDELKPYADKSIIRYHERPDHKWFAIGNKGPAGC
jgi:hypothetical protein